MCGTLTTRVLNYQYRVRVTTYDNKFRSKLDSHCCSATRTNNSGCTMCSHYTGNFKIATSKGAYQSARICRLICVFVGFCWLYTAPPPPTTTSTFFPHEFDDIKAIEPFENLVSIAQTTFKCSDNTALQWIHCSRTQIKEYAFIFHRVQC